MWEGVKGKKKPESKKSSLKSVAPAVHRHKNEVTDKKTVTLKKVGKMKTPERQ